MFEKGEYIVYGFTGVCRVEDITTINMNGANRDRLYYVLEPVNTGGRIYTPIDNNKTVMRRILTQEEAEELINQVLDIGHLWVQDEKAREESYRTALKNCDCREYIRMIKTLYVQQQERSARGRKMSAMDHKYLKMAEDSLYSELSIPLGIPKEYMEDYITERVGHKSADLDKREPII